MVGLQSGIGRVANAVFRYSLAQHWHRRHLLRRYNTLPDATHMEQVRLHPRPDRVPRCAHSLDEFSPRPPHPRARARPQYCTALLNQEKSLEDLQRHLRTTEELFRESVKRKNQQLDLLQSEVRRLKTSVGVRDEAASLQIDAALNAQAGELRRAKEQLAQRDAEVDALNKQVSQLKVELADERARRVAEQSKSDDSSGVRHSLARREEEVEGLRTELAQAQEAATRLQAASMEAEASIESRDAELAMLRAKEAAVASVAAEGTFDSEEVSRLRRKSDEDERALLEEQEARMAAEAHTQELEETLAGREDEIEAEREATREELAFLKAQVANGGEGGGEGGEALEAQRLRSMVEELQQQLAEQRDAASTVGAKGGGSGASSSSLTADRAAALSRLEGRAAAAAAPPAAAGRGSSGPQVRSLVVSGDAVVGATLSAQADFVEAEAALSSFEWLRGNTRLSDKPTYIVTAEDLSHELAVRVTPVGSSGARGEPRRASPSHPIALPTWLRDRLQEWLGTGQKIFTNCHEGDQERHVLFRAGKKEGLKIQDKKGKTLHRGDGYAGVSLKLDGDNTLGFTIQIHGKRPVVAHLTAPQGVCDLPVSPMISPDLPPLVPPASPYLPWCHVACPPHHTSLGATWQVRDLLALVLEAFKDPGSLDRVHVVPTSSNASSLHLSAVGSLSTPRGNGGESPASSITSEQPALADVEDAPGMESPQISCLPRPSMAFHDLPWPRTPFHGLPRPSTAFPDGGCSRGGHRRGREQLERAEEQKDLRILRRRPHPLVHPGTKEEVRGATCGRATGVTAGFLRDMTDVTAGFLRDGWHGCGLIGGEGGQGRRQLWALATAETREPRRQARLRRQLAWTEAAASLDLSLDGGGS